MSIKKSFGGASIRKPGAYSISKQDQSGGAPLGANGTLFILGESELGAPGSVEGIQLFNATQLSDLIAEYGSGPLVDAAKAALVAPSQTPGVGQADTVLVWKTNASTKASLNLSSSAPAVIMAVSDRNYGLPGNRISVKLEAGTDSVRQRIITIQQDDNKQVLDQNAAELQLTIAYTGTGSAATLTIAGTLTNKVLTTTCTGATGDNLNISLNNYNMQQLAQFIAATGKYTCVLGTPLKATITPSSDLDPQAALDIKTAAVGMYRIQEEIVDNINENAQLISAAISAVVAGVPVASGPTFLAGGAKGASASSDFSTGLMKSLAAEYGVALPCISRDATGDIADQLTDPSSAYDIDAVTAALDSHLRLRGSVKNRKEAQGMVGRRDVTVATSYAAAQTVNSELIQMWIQDVLVVDVSGNLVWKQPHVQAALAAGIRLGTDIGEPLTHKFFAVNGVGHCVNPATGIAAGDFNPNTDFDVAIDAGVSFAEQASGAWRVVVDNTTYGKDQSFVWNRGSVVEAAQYCAKTLRETAELVFVGQKVSNGIAGSIKSILRSKLLELNAANIITASDDGAPQGFKEKTFTVVVQGNTAKVSVEIKPVQGLDFIFIEFTLGDISQSA